VRPFCIIATAVSSQLDSIAKIRGYKTDSIKQAFQCV
jgi:hypothetical protein